jgi:hypothetical protein
MMKNPTLLALVSLGLLSVACSFHARGPEQYRDDTHALLESKTHDIKACYDQVLKAQADVAGTVRVSFKVEEETGKIHEAQVDPTGTNAPPQLAECVVRTIDGLVLQPPDKRTGIATFTWEFRPQAAAAELPAPEAPGPG